MVILCEPVSDSPEFIGQIKNECMELKEQDVRELFANDKFETLFEELQGESELGSKLKIWVFRAKADLKKPEPKKL